MPFFRGNLKKLKNQWVTLQVRILKIKKAVTVGKKVSLSASASLTLEAALVLPLFLFAGVILMMPFRIMDTQRQVQAIAEHVSEQIGQTACLAMYGRTDSFWNTAAAYAYGEAAVRSKLSRLPVRRILLGRSSLLEDGETIDLVIDYEVELPFSVFGLGSVEQTVRSCRRAWVGQEGKTGTGEEGEEKEEMVYIGKNSTRYHVNAGCHYLHNDLTAVSAQEVEYKRSQDGSRYTPCSRCGNSAGNTVYILPSGRHYHSSPSCTAINAYVREVPKSQVAYLGVCSYCGRKK